MEKSWTTYGLSVAPNPTMVFQWIESNIVGCYIGFVVVFVIKFLDNRKLNLKPS